MAQARTTYADDGSVTTTTPEFRPEQLGGGGGGDFFGGLGGILGDVIRERLQHSRQQLRQQQVDEATKRGRGPHANPFLPGVGMRAVPQGMPQGAFGGGGGGGGGVLPAGGGALGGGYAPRPTQLEGAAQNAALRAQIAEANAYSRPPPLRMVNDPGVIPGLMPDVNAMTGAQRQVFLPQNAHNTGPNPIDQAKARIALERNERRHAQMEGGYGGYAPGDIPQQQQQPDPWALFLQALMAQAQGQRQGGGGLG